MMKTTLKQYKFKVIPKFLRYEPLYFVHLQPYMDFDLGSITKNVIALEEAFSIMYCMFQSIQNRSNLDCYRNLR
jgi:hypothetical protein